MAVLALAGCGRWERRAVAVASETSGCPREALTAIPNRDGQYTVVGCGRTLAVQCGRGVPGRYRCAVNEPVSASAGGAQPAIVAPPTYSDEALFETDRTAAPAATGDIPLGDPELTVEVR